MTERSLRDVLTGAEKAAYEAGRRDQAEQDGWETCDQSRDDGSYDCLPVFPPVEAAGMAWCRRCQRRMRLLVATAEEPVLQGLMAAEQAAAEAAKERGDPVRLTMQGKNWELSWVEKKLPDFSDLGGYEDAVAEKRTAGEDAEWNRKREEEDPELWEAAVAEKAEREGLSVPTFPAAEVAGNFRRAVGGTEAGR